MRCQCGDTFPLRGRKCAGADQQRAGAALNEGGDSRLDVAVAADIDNDELQTDRLGRGLHVCSLRLGSRTVDVIEHANRRRLGNDLAQQFQSFRPDLGAEPRCTSDVATGPVEAGDEAILDRIGAGHEDDRHRRRCRLGHGRRTAVHHQHGDRDAK